MITLRHIEIYKTYQGDGDGFVRCAAAEEAHIMKYNEWAFIDNMMQDFKLIKGGYASQTYVKAINEKLQENCDSEETIQALKAIADL